MFNEKRCHTKKSLFRVAALFAAWHSSWLRPGPSYSPSLFVAQGFDGIEAGRFPRRIDAEEQADADGEAEGNDDRCRRDDRLEESGFCNGKGDADAAGDAQQAADDTDDDRFDEELHHDILEGGAQGLADADFPCPFCDRYHHDVHDADATDDKGDSGNASQKQGQHSRRAGHGFHEAGQVADGEVIFLVPCDVVALAQQCFHFTLHLFDFIRAGDLDIDGTHVGDAQKTFLSSRERHDDHVVLVLAHGRLALAFQYADNTVRLVVDADCLADGIGCIEQIGCDRRPDDGNAVARFQIIVGDKGTALDVERADVEVFRCHAVYGGVPVLIAVYDLIGTVDGRRNIVDIFDFLFDGFGVVVFQFLAGTGGRSDAPFIGRARCDDEHIAAQAGNGIGDVLAHAHADGNHGDDGADTDDDAQHGQDGAQFIGQECRNGNLYAFTKQHP